MSYSTLIQREFLSIKYQLLGKALRGNMWTSEHIKPKWTERRFFKGCYRNFRHITLWCATGRSKMNFNHFRLMEIIFSTHVTTVHISNQVFFLYNIPRRITTWNCCKTWQLPALCWQRFMLEWNSTRALSSCGIVFSIFLLTFLKE